MRLLNRCFVYHCCVLNILCLVLHLLPLAPQIAPRIDQSKVYEAVTASLVEGDTIGIFPEARNTERRFCRPLNLSLFLMASHLEEFAPPFSLYRHLLSVDFQVSVSAHLQILPFLVFSAVVYHHRTSHCPSPLLLGLRLLQGGSHDRTTLLPLKAGVAIMALTAMQHGAEEVLIVPVGLTYHNPHKMQSRASVHIGDPVPVSYGHRPKANSLGAFDLSWRVCLIACCVTILVPTSCILLRTASLVFRLHFSFCSSWSTLYALFSFFGLSA